MTIDLLGAATNVFSVLLGAILAYASTSGAERRKERREGVARATLLFLKFRNVVDGIYRIDRQLREGMRRAEEHGIDGPAWAQFEEIVAIGDYEEIITVEDMAILAEYGHYDLIEAAAELRDGHNGIVRALSQVFRLKNGLAKTMPPQQMQGNVASYDGPPPPEALAVIANLDMLADDVLEMLDQMKSRARDVVPAFNHKLKSSLKLKTFPQIVLPDETPPGGP